MTPEEKLKGLKTSLKITLSVVERLEALNEDFECGVRCLSAEKAQYVYDMLILLLEPIQESSELDIQYDTSKLTVKVMKHAKKPLVQVLDQEEQKLSEDFQSAVGALRLGDDSESSTESFSGRVN